MQLDPATAGELAAWKEGRTVTEPRPSATVWGTGIRAYTPIRNRAGQMVGHAGITMRADQYTAWMRRVDEAAAIGLLVGLVLAGLGGMRRARNERTRLEAQALIDREKETLYSRQKMEALGTLAGGVAHDFNNILTVILGHAQMIGDETPAGSQAAASVNTINTAAMRARDLVNRILMFARSGAEGRTPTSLTHAVDETVELLTASMPDSVEIVWRPPERLVVVTIDSTRLTQILMNLGVNARQALPEDAGRIEFVVDEVTLDASSATPLSLEPGLFARIVVRDNGIGMSDETKRRMFEPFFTTKPVGQGTGLGLAVVDGLVRGHGGAIEATSALGAGSTFVIYLPSATPAEAASVANQLARRGGTRSGRAGSDLPELPHATQKWLPANK